MGKNLTNKEKNSKEMKNQNSADSQSMIETACKYLNCAFIFDNTALSIIHPSITDEEKTHEMTDYAGLVAYQSDALFGKNILLDVLRRLGRSLPDDHTCVMEEDMEFAAQQLYKCKYSSDAIIDDSLKDRFKLACCKAIKYTYLKSAEAILQNVPDVDYDVILAIGMAKSFIVKTTEFAALYGYANIPYENLNLMKTFLQSIQSMFRENI